MGSMEMFNTVALEEAMLGTAKEFYCILYKYTYTFIIS